MKLKKLFMFMGMIGLVGFTSVTFKPTHSSAQAVEFSDVKKESVHYKGIYWLVNKGAVTGYPDGTFKWENPLSRPHAAKLFVGALELKKIASGDVTTYFDDIEPTHIYADYIATVGQEGVFTGSDRQFMPEKQLTREQMATTLVRAFELESPRSKVRINLNNVNASHKESVQILADLKITTEITDYRPTEPVTRAQFASLLYRIAHMKEEVFYTPYHYDFKTMVDKQMAITGTARPKTDIAATWYEGSRAMVEYYANPNNFEEGTTGFYQFLVLSGSAGLNQTELNEVLTDGGVLKNKGAAFLDASRTYGVNEMYLIAHAYLESGRGTSSLATGKHEVGLNENGTAVMVTSSNRDKLTNIKRVYNLFGIKANDSCPATCGSVHAYQQGWFNVDAAIDGGAKFIAGNYFNQGQDTLYKMRWNPSTPATHQYATDVAWAIKQTTRMRDILDELYDRSENVARVYDVPEFKRTPAKTVLPTGEAIFRIDTTHPYVGKKAVTTAKEGLNFRKVPTTSGTFGDTVIRKLPLGTEVTILAENTNWFKVKADNLEGWVSGAYLNINDVKTASFMASASELVEVEMEASAPQEIVIGNTIKDDISLRAEPNETANILQELSNETEVEILEEVHDWFKVKTADQEGWIPVDAISVTNIEEIK